jgi:hypothetical protein
MKKRILGLVFLIFICLQHTAQTDSVYYGDPAKDTMRKVRKERNNDWLDKVTYGGNFQLSFGTYTNIYLAPTIGYTPFKRFNFGAGFIYNYVSINYSGYGRFEQTIYGGTSYARYYFGESFFGQAQFDYLLQPNVFNYKNPKEKVWVEYFLVGGGYRQMLGKRAALVTSIMVNLTPNKLSLYPNPIFQVGFVGGF